MTIKRPIAPFRAFAEYVPQVWPEGVLGAWEHTGWMDEQLSWKTNCYLGDWSFVPEIRFKGPDVIKLFADLSINSFASFPIGKAKHCVQCNEHGKVISEGVLFRHAEEDLEYNCTTPLWTLFNMETGDYDVKAEFPVTYKLQVQGPKALQLLEKLTAADLHEVRFMASKTARIAGEDVIFLRQGMAGEIGFELRGPHVDRNTIYAAVLEAGREFGIREMGRRTVQINHLEASYPTGYIHFVNALPVEKRSEYARFVANLPAEIAQRPFLGGPGSPGYLPATFTGSWDGKDREQLCRSPVEMGWGKNIKFDHEFVGRAALEKEVAHPRRTLVTLEYNSEDMIRIYASLFGQGDAYRLFEVPHPPFITVWDDQILKGGQTIGDATYPGFSYFFRKVLALSFIDPAYSAPGEQVTVLWGNPGEPQTEIRATVARAPYKKDDRRADLTKLRGG